MIHIRKLLLFAFTVVILSACDMFKIDNYDGPDATIKGSILDEVTGELVETDVLNGSIFQLQDLGTNPDTGKPYATGLRTFVINYTGEYQDKMFFSGPYSIDFNSCNFYPFHIESMVFKKGENVNDFKVKPYIRVKNVKIERVGNEVVATFNLQAGNPEVRLSNIRLFASTDVHVGQPYTAHNPDVVKGSDGKDLLIQDHSQTFSPVIAIDEATTYRLKFDLTKPNNSDFFKYKGKDYYFRVGAMASVPNPSSVTGKSVGTIRTNYAHYTVIKF